MQELGHYQTRTPGRRDLRDALTVLELECAATCHTCCCANDNPVYVVRKGSWMHPQTEAERGPISTVVLVGGTGVGKSNLANFIVGRYAFVSRNSPESVTTAPQVVEGTWFGGRDPVRVVDCAGIGDTRGTSVDQRQWEAALNLLQEVGQVNALILVMKAGRFTQSEKDMIAKLRECFGPGFWRHLIVFYTGSTAKPDQLSLERLAPEMRQRLLQVEVDLCGDCDALQDIQTLSLYGADLDPTLATEENRAKEFRLKRALKDMELEELLDLDRRIPYNILEMTDTDLERFTRGPAAEAWIQGNYFQLGVSRLLNLQQATKRMEPFTLQKKTGKWETTVFVPPTKEEELEREEPEEGEEQVDLSLAASTTERGAASSSAAADEVPDSGAKSESDPGSPKYHPNMSSIRRALLEADMVFVRGPWVDKAAVKNGGVLPRREDLLSEAIWDAEISYIKNDRKFYLL